MSEKRREMECFDRTSGIPCQRRASSGRKAATRGSNYATHSEAEGLFPAVAAVSPPAERKWSRSPTRADGGGAAVNRADTAEARQEAFGFEIESSSEAVLETVRNAKRRDFLAGGCTARCPKERRW